MSLTAFGFIAVGTMFVTYWLEDRSPWFLMIFAAACAASAAYGFLAGTVPFGIVETLWAGVALQRFRTRRAAESRI
jgi:hypothetical protein